jgi:hypothetical protein
VVKVPDVSARRRRSAKKTSIFQGIKEGLEQAIEYAKGAADPSVFRVHTPADNDVKTIRKSTKRTQK